MLLILSKVRSFHQLISCRHRFPSFLLNHSKKYSEDSTTCDSKIVRIQFVDRVGNIKQIEGKVDDNLMTLARQHNIEIEGACEASLACSTCHVYIDQKFYNQLPPASEEEEDMLDLAVFLQENSRLSCQIFLTKELDGMKVTLPRATRNFYVDGHVPQPH